MGKYKIEKRTFELSKLEIVKLVFYKDKILPVARSSPLGYFNLGTIQIDALFYKFTKSEQKSIIYHEFWHYKNNLSFMFKFEIMNPKFLFSKKAVSYQQEFEADKFAVERNGKTPTLAMLLRLQKWVKKGIIPEDSERHPSLKERIKRVEKM